jgi:hypothetical protein
MRYISFVNCKIKSQTPKQQSTLVLTRMSSSADNDVSFSTDSSDEDDNETTMMVDCIINSNIAVAKASINFMEEIYHNQPTKRGGSMPGKAPNKNRDFEDAYQRLLRDYFSGVNSVYDEVDFQRRFRINRDVFNRIYQSILGIGKFVHKSDCTGKPGIHPLVRTVACFRYLAYGSTFDATDEHLRLSESACSESIKDFCTIMIQQFGEYYLNRSPSEEEKHLILNTHINRKVVAKM